MAYRKWIIVTLVFTLVLCVCSMGLNYYGDTFDYFGAMAGKVDRITSDKGYTRVIKAKYIERNADQYNAVVIGGSKAGAIDTETLNEVTGLRFYNSYFTSGCFRDYLAYANYYLNKMDLEEMVLHISSIEINAYEPTGSSKMLDLPAVVTGESMAKEAFSFLIVNVDESAKKIGKQLLGKSDDFYEDKIDGTRDLKKYYSLDAEEIVSSSTLMDYDIEMDTLCLEQERDTDSYEDNLLALEQIKKMCDERGVKLTVIVGASFIGEKARYEGDVFYDYLRDIVEITEVYDFSGFYDVNLNPYNFYNSGHYYYEVADEMLRIVYGEKENAEFGVLLTQDNIDSYLVDRKEAYNKILEEYNSTGTVELLGREDASNLCR